MKPNAVPSLLAAILLAAACSSSSGVSSGPRAKIIEPTLEIRQVVGPAELGYPQGQIEVKYQLRITNNSSEPLTLRKVHFATVNPQGGAYSVREREYFMKETIPPNSIGAVEVWVRAYGWGRGLRDSEPVTLKGVAYYDTPVGYYNQVFVKEIGQYPGQNDG